MDLLKTETRLKLVALGKEKINAVGCDVHGQPEEIAFMLVLACQAVPHLKNILEAAVRTMNSKESTASMDHVRQTIKVMYVKG